MEWVRGKLGPVALGAAGLRGAASTPSPNLWRYINSRSNKVPRFPSWAGPSSDTVVGKMVRAGGMPVTQDLRDPMAEQGLPGTLREGPYKQRAQLAHHINTQTSRQQECC